MYTKFVFAFLYRAWVRPRRRRGSGALQAYITGQTELSSFRGQRRSGPSRLRLARGRRRRTGRVRADGRGGTGRGQVGRTIGRHRDRREVRGRERGDRLGGRAGCHDLLGTRRTARGHGRGHAGDRLHVQHRSQGGERRRDVGAVRADGRHVSRRGRRHRRDGGERRRVGRLGRGRRLRPEPAPASPPGLAPRSASRRRRPLRRAVEPARVAAAGPARDGVARRPLGVALVHGIRRVGRRAPDEVRRRADEGDGLDGRDGLQRQGRGGRGIGAHGRGRAGRRHQRVDFNREGGPGRDDAWR
mmetsp:Transcript_5672/g.13140  ORF Transcript_5672/g.13140 Transcript_5672/m.13140 type:complete len:301 (+) Transcript_5672:42-944(+)